MERVTVRGHQYSKERALLTIKSESFSYRFDLDLLQPPSPLLATILQAPGNKWVEGSETLNLLARLSLPCNSCQSLQRGRRVRSREQEQRLALLRRLSVEND